MPLLKDFDVMTRQNIRSDGIEIHFVKYLPTGGMKYISKIEVGSVTEQEREKEAEAGIIREDEPLMVSEYTAQQMVDQFWKDGIRAREGVGTAGALSATRDHMVSLKERIEHLERVTDKLWSMVEKAYDHAWGDD